MNEVSPSLGFRLLLPLQASHLQIQEGRLGVLEGVPTLSPRHPPHPQGGCAVGSDGPWVAQSLLTDEADLRRGGGY